MTSHIRSIILFLLAVGLLATGAVATYADDPDDDFPVPADDPAPVEQPAGDTADLAAQAAAMDTDKDGRISKAEWKGPPAIFDRIDVNKDGFLDAADRAVAPVTPAAPAEGAPAPTEDKGSGWSAPAVTPGAGSDLGSLPPPRIVRRRGSAPTGRTALAATNTRPRTPVRDVPSVRTPPFGRRPAFRPQANARSGMLPSRTTGFTDTRIPARPPPPPMSNFQPIPATPAAPVARTPAARTPDMRTPAVPTRPTARAVGGGTPIPTRNPGTAGDSGSAVRGISKTHNVPIPKIEGQDQELALQLDVDYEVRGQKGSNVYVAIWFARKDTGALVNSGVPGYADAAGNVTLQTHSAPIGTDDGRYNATLRIPYRAFPIAAGERSYDVEARVEILRAEPNNKVTVLCRGTTTFRVYGFEE